MPIGKREREGWRALKYKSWRECVQKEFGYRIRHLYRLLTAAKIEREVFESPDLCPAGHKQLPEKHARALAHAPVGTRASIYAKALADGRKD